MDDKINVEKNFTVTPGEPDSATSIEIQPFLITGTVNSQSHYSQI